MSKLTQETFLKDVDKHQMTVVRDEGTHRHVIFAQPDSYNMRFELITWPGWLCYTGDMGTFVFRRLEDMFAFFRDPRPVPELRIDLQYWAEKLDAIDRHDGFERWSPEKFRAVIENYLEDAEASPELRVAVAEEVLRGVDLLSEDDARQAANSFEHHGFRFHDLWERNCKEYSHRFIWCCFALAWGIRQYDAGKSQPAPVSPQPSAQPTEVTA